MPFGMYLLLWCGLGVLGSILMVVRSARPFQTMGLALFALPHALIFGPLFLLLILSGWIKVKH